MPEKAPDVFQVVLQCTNGDVVIECHREWAPLGVERFYELVKLGFYTDIRIFRVVEGFIAQFGISGDPKLSDKWANDNILDDPVRESNVRGTVTFATSGRNSRTTQIFINYGDNRRLDSMGFAPFGKVVSGMDVADKFYSGYGEKLSRLQNAIESTGNGVLDSQFPNLDSIKKAEFVKLNQ
ncbi:MAG: peptidylprolyl isomerase [Candidatus Hydrogenedentes bacterium]|nr:peptidylprolyl isomerase [Candidatus Hydrogenedentota bacterium]